MCKKLIKLTLAIGIVAGLTLGTDAVSYLSTAYHRATDGVKENIPVTFQIDRARQLVRDLAPEVRRSMQVIAKEEIELERINEQIAESADRNEKSKEDIVRLQADLSSGQQRFRYAGHSYTRAEVTEDLSRRFTRHKVSDETLGHLRAMRDARQHNLDAARQKLTAMVAAQKKLETDIVNLEAKERLVTVAQASSDAVLDDSQLARAEKLIDDIRTRLDVAAKLANADVSFPGEIVLDETETTDVVDQVATYFDLDAQSVAKADRGASKAIVAIHVD